MSTKSSNGSNTALRGARLPGIKPSGTLHRKSRQPPTVSALRQNRNVCSVNFDRLFSRRAEDVVIELCLKLLGKRLSFFAFVDRDRIHCVGAICRVSDIPE